MDLSGGRLSCIDTLMTLSLKQSDLAFTGTHTASTLTCVDNANGQPVSTEIPAGTVINGSVSPINASANVISFDLDTPESHYTGELNLPPLFFLFFAGESQKVDFGAPRGVTVLTGTWNWEKP